MLAFADGSKNGPRILAIRVANALGKPLGINPFPRSFPNELTTETADRSAVFDRIYRMNFWASSESRSGLGSETGFAAAYRERLGQCLREIGAKCLFDAPCGDLNWIAPLIQASDLEYLGGDISASLVADLKQSFPGIAVRAFNICTDQFPQADVWHCRDCLFHLPFEDIHRALANFCKSAIPFALITTHRARWHRNLDVNLGGFRYLDLERPPFALPKADRYLRDHRPVLDFPRYVGLWRRESIAEALSRLS